MTELYIVRHGESLGNFEKRFLGHTDLELTERGFAQAGCASRYFKDVHIDSVYSSDLKRAFYTAKAIADTKGLSVTPIKALREIYAGAWETLPICEIEEKYSDIWQEWRSANSSDFKLPDGESFYELTQRVYEAILDIAQKNEGKSVVVTFHATSIRVFVNKIMKRSLENLYETPWVANASVTKVNFDNQEFSIEFFDDCSHLGAIKTVLPSNV